ncbi:KH domain-containing protein [candidate division WWE3 bacterium]|uniref:KH domain-containing protein n=1 Tax=candidate division WWE3 bacterium TaxID=2053526 RepID=A0A955LGQ7_UNCKA|nr:KH domain-containing protein [candidate division WWE3 bacterium]
MDPQTITDIKNLTEQLLQHLGVTGEVTVEVDESAVVQVTINSAETDSDEDSDTHGILIGYHGETLRALQLVLSLMINQDREEWVQLIVDVDGYRHRRDEQLISLANRMAEKVMYLKEPIALNPMPAIDRRIIHMALADNDQVISESSGQGRDRKIVISPK